MASETYTTIGGETVDFIAWERFGKTRGVVEQVLQANPGLSARGPVLPAGVVVTLPLPVVQDRSEAARLWS